LSAGGDDLPQQRLGALPVDGKVVVHEENRHLALAPAGARIFRRSISSTTLSLERNRMESPKNPVTVQNSQPYGHPRPDSIGMRWNPSTRLEVFEDGAKEPGMLIELVEIERLPGIFGYFPEVRFMLLAEGVHRFTVPITYYKLPNGLRVILSPDSTAPTVVTAVYYRIGFRVEPKDRTGFAHLFEHMMFQGSRNLGKMEFIRLVQQNGGVLNGSTRFDFTNYFELLPSNKLETALWAEADRMKGLAITEENLKNQQGVVGNEVER
jgi:hypothetical protein